MSYKIKDIPSPGAKKEEIADYWEVQAIKNPEMFISQININKSLALVNDELDHDGINSAEDEIDIILEEAYKELSRRVGFTNNSYPFEFKKYSIKYKKDKNIYSIVYQYLLLCTRLNMKFDKTQNGIDGTLLFEELSAYVSNKYFGKRAKTFIFGTSKSGGFKEKVEDFIKRTGEGKAFKNPNTNPPTANDFSIDIVSYLDFSDKRVGKLLAFGQCKTGTSWKDEIKKLKPDEFCKMWLLDDPISAPVPIIFLCDTLHEDMNFYQSQLGYIVFNRFRILELVDEDIPVKLFKKITTWVDGANKILSKE